VLAEAAEALAAGGEAAPGASPRAHALLRRLDAWAERGKSRHVPESEEAIWSALQHVAWCPVLVSPPEPGLPWPHQPPPTQEQREGAAAADGSDSGAADRSGSASGAAAGTQPLALAPPRMARPAGEAWVASAPLRLCAGPAGAPLCRLLGWARPLPAPMAVAQLVELARMYPATAEWPTDAPAAAKKLAEAALRLYAALGDALADPLQRENLELSLRSAPVVWVGTGFADGDAAALAPGGTGAGAPGLLFEVPPGVAAEHDAVLRLAGARDRWVFVWRHTCRGATRSRLLIALTTCCLRLMWSS
jgi:hypothetical protein